MKSNPKNYVLNWFKIQIWLEILFNLTPILTKLVNVEIWHVESIFTRIAYLYSAWKTGSLHLDISFGYFCLEQNYFFWPSLLTLFYCSTEKCIKICSIVKLLYTYLIKYINNKTGYWPLSELCLPNIQQEQPPKGAKGIIFSLSTLNTTIVLTWIGWIDPML